MDKEELAQSQRSPEPEEGVPHYYGDIIRNLFIIAGLAMLATLPILKTEVPVSVPFSLVFVLVVGLAAGLTSPHHRWIMAVNAVIAFCGVAMFEYAAVNLSELWSLFFWTNQFLAIVFFIALYYSAKSLRWMVWVAE